MAQYQTAEGGVFLIGCDEGATLIKLLSIDEKQKEMEFNVLDEK